MIRSPHSCPVSRSPVQNAVRLRSRLRAVAMALAVALTSSSLWAQANETVGQVSLLIGGARLVHKDGKSEALRQGAGIAVGDRIETAANGHVHVRFIDNAAVSVRPESVLEVQAYRYDAANPQSNEVRLKVAQGIGRSISGAATDADKTRFRLNTPIAAIGVRGTDFIVQASADHVRATVASGAIIMSPLGNGCLADGVGPCNGRLSSLLSSDMGRLMVEMRPGDRSPRVVPAINALLASSTPAIDARAAAHAAAALAAANPTFDTRNDRAAAQVLAIAPLGPFDARDFNTPPESNAQLAWGRWTLSTGKDNISLPYATAFNDKERHVTLGDGEAALFRKGDADSAASVFANSPLGRVDFRLTRAYASYDIDSRSEAASVDGGTLSVDFTKRTFATALALASETAGKSELRVGGAIQSTGLFVVSDVDQVVKGAISLDTKEAGYLFERQVGRGVFRGRTLWGR